VCGAENPRGFHLRSRVEEDVVALDYTTQPHDTGYTTIVHGGVIMTLLDEVMTWAAILAAGRMCVAGELTSRLLKSIAVGTRLRVEGRVTRDARRLVLTEGRVTDGAGVLLAEATGKYAPVPADRISLQDKDFIEGPGTIPLRDIIRE
jgi:uncharacterized protein (TIGR00369 family)